MEYLDSDVGFRSIKWCEDRPTLKKIFGLEIEKYRVTPTKIAYNQMNRFTGL
jgi:hypothetical protein